jgi:hypothetical protein
MSVTVLADHRTPGGRFAKGHSGNPAGRPKGARNRATVLVEQLEESGPDLLAGAVGDALGGDAVTLRTLLGLMLPRAGDRTIEIDLAPGAERDDEALFAATLRAIVDGVISPAEGLRVGRLIALRAKVAEHALRLKLRAPGNARPSKTAPPVSNLYSDAESPSPARGGTRQVQPDGARQEGNRPLSSPRPQAAEAVARPVSDLYFSCDRTKRPPRSDLYSSTAGRAGVPALPFAAAAARDAIQRLRPCPQAAI